MPGGIVQVECCDIDMCDSRIVLNQRKHRDILAAVWTDGLVIADYPAPVRNRRHRRNRLGSVEDEGASVLYTLWHCDEAELAAPVII